MSAVPSNSSISITASGNIRITKRRPPSGLSPRRRSSLTLSTTGCSLTRRARFELRLGYRRVALHDRAAHPEFLVVRVRADDENGCHDRIVG